MWGLPRTGWAGPSSPSVRFLPTETLTHPLHAPQLPALVLGHSQLALGEAGVGEGDTQALELSTCGPTEVTKKLSFPAQLSQALQRQRGGAES